MDLWKTELRDDGVFVAAYDNPPMNYFTGQATAELGELLARWRDPDVKAVVITGAPAGKYITHYSVEELVQGSAHPEQLRRSFPESIAAWHSLLQNITYLDKAVVAGITGDAGGAGWSSRSTATSASCSAATSESVFRSARSASSPVRARRC